MFPHVRDTPEWKQEEENDKEAMLRYDQRGHIGERDGHDPDKGRVPGLSGLSGMPVQRQN